MKKLLAVDIVTENCDVFRVNVPDIDICINGITDHIASYNGDGTLLREKMANEVILVIKPNAYEIKSDFSEVLFKAFAEDRFYENITHIDLVYNDNTNEYIMVPWKGDNYVNKAQKVEVLEDKIIISLRN